MPSPAVPFDILLVSDDLMFPSRVREGLRPLGHTLKTVGSEAAVQSAIAGHVPSAILVNLTARRYDPLAVIAFLKGTAATAAVPLLAFAGHVETEKHEAARRAGADMVAANSSVSMHLPALLKKLLGGIASADAALIDLHEDADVGA
jgi:CheY-like chemotaxis protein